MNNSQKNQRISDSAGSFLKKKFYVKNEKKTNSL